jgi:hypothetical protein
MTVKIYIVVFWVIPSTRYVGTGVSEVCTSSIQK